MLSKVDQVILCKVVPCLPAFIRIDILKAFPDPEIVALVIKLFGMPVQFIKEPDPVFDVCLFLESRIS